jgi:CubicO group peptidase (beta-lactamase class C family)
MRCFGILAITACTCAIAVATTACAGSHVNDDSPPSSDAITSRPPALHYDFAALDDGLFAGSWKTEGVVVLHEGNLVHEKYATGFDANKRHILYSASKSIGSALVGIAIADGLLKLEDSVCKYVTPPTGADKTLCDTTIEHLVQMRSGLTWTETYDDPTKSDVLPMLYGDEADMGEFAARHPRSAKAGDVWSYSSGDSNLLARALRGALGGKDMRAWAKEKLFAPAGMSSAIFETDRSGTLVFSSSCFMTPRDMARFGQLYLDDGMSGTTRVLPAKWVEYTHTPAPPVATPKPRVAGIAPGDSGGSYGAAFWLNAATATASSETLLYPEAPLDTYSAEGHWGQKIFIVPSRKLVIARVGNDRSPIFDPGAMVAAAVTAVDAATSSAKGAGR